MVTTMAKPKPTFTPLYRGAETCDFRPEWGFTDTDAVTLANAAFDDDPDDLTSWLVLADRLEEIGHPAAETVRWGCLVWQKAAKLKPSRKSWDQEKCQKAMQVSEKSVVSWRKVCVWGCLLAWHSPSGIEGVPMGRTWTDARTRTTSRGVWCWALGLCDDAAWSQADAAGSQADAAWRQAYAAGSQAYAAGSQADAAGSQADAAGSQADAAWSQADAAGRQAYAAGRQAYAAGSQAVWSYAKALWEMLGRNPMPREKS